MSSKSEIEHKVDIYQWNGQGYKPQVAYNDWMVAILNWEPIFDPANFGEIERHQKSDEVFVLLKGHGALFIAADRGIEVFDMMPGAVYNVKQGTWHNLVATQDASWIIVETKGTDIHDTEIRQMTDNEREKVLQLTPHWDKN